MAGSGTTLSDLYSSAQRLKMELREELERIEKLELAVTSSSNEEPIAFSPDLTRTTRLKLAELQRSTLEMERLCRSQPQRSQIWKR